MLINRIRSPWLWVLPLFVILMACGNGGDEGADAETGDLYGDIAASAGESARTPGVGDSAVVVETGTPVGARGAQDGDRTAAGPEPAAPAQVRPEWRTIPQGTAFQVRLMNTLSTERNRVGDAFTAALVNAIVTDGGELLVPAGATVSGRVTALEPSTRARGGMAVLKVAFETLAFGGQSYTMHAAVTEANAERRTRGTRTQQAGRAAAGATAGAMIGRVIGERDESGAAGAALGAAAGTAIAMGTAEVDAVLSNGSRLTLRLSAPLRVQVGGGT